MMYEDSRPTPESEVMMLKAIVDPIMMRARRAVKMRVTMTALSGISQPGRTFQSLVTLQNIVLTTYSGQKFGEGQTAVARKGKELARGRGDLVHGT